MDTKEFTSAIETNFDWLFTSWKFEGLLPYLKEQLNEPHVGRNLMMTMSIIPARPMFCCPTPGPLKCCLCPVLLHQVCSIGMLAIILLSNTIFLLCVK